jgi:hypothetical protein
MPHREPIDKRELEAMRVSLQYPNGRMHEATVERDAPLRVGDEFEMHGRRWRVMAQKHLGRRAVVSLNDDAPLLCRSTN